MDCFNDEIARKERPYRSERGERTSRVTVAIITRRKPQFLARVLDSLSEMEPPRHAHVRILVVDNDGQMSAYKAVSDVHKYCPYPIVYVVEGRPGIPQARNRAVAESRTEDYILFIDDDERIGESNWVGMLLGCQREFDADVVQGPVYPEYLEPPPNLVVRGNFFRLRTSRQAVNDRAQRLVTHL